MSDAATGPVAAGTGGDRRTGTVLRSIGAVLVSNGVYLAAGFAANVIAANALSPGRFGYFAIAVGTMSVAQEICGTGFDVAMVRLGARESLTSAAHTHQVVRAAFRAKLLVNGTLATLLVVGAEWLAVSVFGDLALATALRWAAPGVIGTTLLQHALARLQMLERFRMYAALRSLQSALRTLLLLALAWMGMFTVETALFVTAVALLAASAAGLWTAPAAGRGAGETSRWRELFRFGRWMMAAHMLFALYGRIDVLTLAAFRDATEVGYYNLAWNFGFMIDVCTFSIITALLPSVSRMRQVVEFRRYAKQTLIVCSAIGIALLPGLYLVAPVTDLLFPGYDAAVPAFRVLFWGSLVTLLTHPLYLIVYARDRVRSVALSNLCLVVTAALGCWVLVPRFGMLGAAYASVAARCINGVLVAGLAALELRESRAAPLPAHA